MKTTTKALLTLLSPGRSLHLFRYTEPVHHNGMVLLSESDYRFLEALAEHD